MQSLTETRLLNQADQASQPFEEEPKKDDDRKGMDRELLTVQLNAH
jgi:hypothetical protein